MHQICLILGMLAACTAQAGFESAFRQAEPDARPWVYWYWMNGNIVKEGAVEDLRALHRVGVGGAYLMDIGIHPIGPVEYRSAAWYEATSAVMKEAEKLGMRIGFHCPGWSASGGPWIKPEQGMQEIVWTETQAEGDAPIRLQQPAARLNTYRDSFVIAFPSPSRDAPVLKANTFSLVADGKPLTNKETLFDANPDTGAEMPTCFDLNFDKSTRLQSVYLRSPCRSGDFSVTLQAKDDAGNYQKLTTITSGQAGPFSETHGSSTFVPVTTTSLRFTFEGRQERRPVFINDLVLTDGYRMHNWTQLTGLGAKPVNFDVKTQQPEADDCIPLASILDLSTKMKADGTLDWRPPSGRWTILRMGYVPTGVEIKPPPLKGGIGLECDKMSRDVTDAHYEAMMQPLFQAYGVSVKGKVLTKYHVDSYEPGWQNWTPKMAAEFKKYRGYELYKWMPALTGRAVESFDQTRSFLWDFRRTIADLYADNHYGRLAERCHQDGLQFSTEPYGGPFEFLQVGGRSDYPMVEFWTGPRNLLPSEQEARKSYYHGISSAHTYGRRVIGSEAFTSEEGWLIHPYALKSLGDVHFASGINQFIIHVSAHQPYLTDRTMPGFTSGINGIHFDRGNTWFYHGGKEWVDYLIRCQSVLQQGTQVADFAYYQGDDAPCEGSRMEPTPPEGFDADALNTEVLSTAKVDQHDLVLVHGKRYRYLVLPRNGRITFTALQHIKRLSDAGARLVGPKPIGSPSLADTQQKTAYRQLTETLWQNDAIPNLKTLSELVKRDSIATDFAYTTEDQLTLHYTHRQDEQRDVYFVANGNKKRGEVRCTFRTDGGRPQLWNPLDGSMTECIAYTVETDNRITLPLWFNESDSTFVVFDRTDRTRKPLTLSRQAAAQEKRKALTIFKAEYGAKGKLVDVTDKVRAKVSNDTLTLKGFTQLKGDPMPGVRKTLTLSYLLDNQPRTLSAVDDETLLLPPRRAEQQAELVTENGKPYLLALMSGTYTVGTSTYHATVPATVTLSSNTSWTIAFQKNRGAPDQITTANLGSLSTFADEGVKYFSGTATYTTTFDAALPTRGSAKTYLDLGDVAVIASARLNGTLLGTCWKPPFRFDVTEQLKAGKNTLSVEVTTTWVNRLIGDERFPDDVTKNGTWKEGGVPVVPEWLRKDIPRPEPRRVTFAAFKFWKATDPLHPAGLLGPVTLQTAQLIPLKTSK